MLKLEPIFLGPEVFRDHFYHSEVFSKIFITSPKISQKPHLRPSWGPNLGQNFFLKNLDFFISNHIGLPCQTASRLFSSSFCLFHLFPPIEKRQKDKDMGFDTFLEHPRSIKIVFNEWQKNLVSKYFCLFTVIQDACLFFRKNMGNMGIFSMKYGRVL